MRLQESHLNFFEIDTLREVMEACAVMIADPTCGVAAVSRQATTTGEHNHRLINRDEN